jgi:integrase
MSAPRRRLTQRDIDCAAASVREYTLWDPAMPGFGLRVRPTGYRAFVFTYRTLGGKVRRLTLGDPRVLTLDQARKAARDYAYQVSRDEDPAATRAAARKSTLAAIYQLYKEARTPEFSPAHRIRVCSIFEIEILPRLGQKPITTITRSDVRELTDAKRASKKPAMANNIHRVFSAFLTWCHVDRDYIPANPLYGIPLPSRHRSRDRVLKDHELAAIWRGCARLNNQWGPAIRLLMLTGMRRTEVLGAAVQEIDLDRRTWTIPKERSKNRNKHTVYLSAQALDIIHDVLGQGRRWREYLFQSAAPLRSRYQPIPSLGPKSVAATTASIRKLKKIVPIEDWCLHDLRRSFATHVAALGVAPHVISVMLNHRSGFRTGVTAIYNRHEYAPEAKAAWELWGNTLDAWVNKEYPEPRNKRTSTNIDDEDVLI